MDTSRSIFREPTRPPGQVMTARPPSLHQKISGTTGMQLKQDDPCTRAAVLFCRRTPLPPVHETTATAQPNKRNNDPGARVVLFCRGAPRAPGQHWQERCRAYLGKPPVQEQRKLNRMIHAHGPLYFFSRWAPRPPGRRMTTMPPSLQRKNGQHGRKAHNEKRIKQARNKKELTALCLQFFVIVAT